MDDLGVVLLSHRVRLQRIADVLTRYGLAEWVNRVRDVDDLGILGSRLAKAADSDLAGLTKGERLRGALVDLGTTWVKFGQMLSLRPDMVGAAVARELEQLQATVPADPPGVAQSRVESELKAPTTDLFAAFDPEPFASGSVAQVHHAELRDGTPVVVKVLHDGADRVVRDDLDLMTALAGFLQDRDAEMALYRVALVSEFATMMRSAIDLTQERSNLELFAANFAAEPRCRHSRRVPGVVQASGAHHERGDRVSDQPSSQRGGHRMGRRDPHPTCHQHLPRNDLPRRAVPRGPPPRELLDP
jgi:ubiquinone biosynthesis protein